MGDAAPSLLDLAKSVHPSTLHDQSVNISSPTTSNVASTTSLDQPIIPVPKQTADSCQISTSTSSSNSQPVNSADTPITSLKQPITFTPDQPFTSQLATADQPFTSQLALTSSDHDSTQHQWLSMCIQVYLFNAGSLANKLSQFQSFLYSHQPSVFAVCETWLCDHHYNSEVIPSGYYIYHKDRCSRGGVLLDIDESLSVAKLTSPSDLEILTVEINGSIAISLVYVPLSSNSSFVLSLSIYMCTFV